LFRGARRLLQSHRGYDRGARILAHSLARAMRAPVVVAMTSRLLVDLNRSPGHRQQFSAFTRRLPAAERAVLVDRHYRPHRARVEVLVDRLASRGHRVIHIAAHSFTPVLGRDVRRADVGLLYDPTRRGEVELCARWKAALHGLDPMLRIRRNYPYAGKADGLTSHLRARHACGAYVGIELEVNQRIVIAGGRRWSGLRAALAASLQTASRA
jgi:predicted N-formylglutamate amidohydrolase